MSTCIILETTFSSLIYIYILLTLDKGLSFSISSLYIMHRHVYSPWIRVCTYMKYVILKISWSITLYIAFAMHSIGYNSHILVIMTTISNKKSWQKPFATVVQLLLMPDHCYADVFFYRWKKKHRRLSAGYSWPYEEEEATVLLLRP